MSLNDLIVGKFDINWSFKKAFDDSDDLEFVGARSLLVAFRDQVS